MLISTCIAIPWTCHAGRSLQYSKVSSTIGGLRVPSCQVPPTAENRGAFAPVPCCSVPEFVANRQNAEGQGVLLRGMSLDGAHSLKSTSVQRARDNMQSRLKVVMMPQCSAIKLGEGHFQNPLKQWTCLYLPRSELAVRFD